MKNSIFHLDTQRAIRVGSVISSNIRFHHSLTSGLKRHYSRKRESHSWARKMIIFQQNFIFPSVICISYGCMYSVFIVVVTTMSPCFAGMKQLQNVVVMRLSLVSIITFQGFLQKSPLRWLIGAMPISIPFSVPFSIPFSNFQFPISKLPVYISTCAHYALPVLPVVWRCLAWPAYQFTRAEEIAS